MKFEIVQTDCDFGPACSMSNEACKNRIEKIIKDYPRLRDFGFEIENPDNYPKAYIYIYSIEELVKLKNAVDDLLIIGNDWIEIYNDYRE